MTERITVSISDDVHERLHNRLEFGDNRSAIVEEALTEYLNQLEA